MKDSDKLLRAAELVERGCAGSVFAATYLADKRSLDGGASADDYVRRVLRRRFLSSWVARRDELVCGLRAAAVLAMSEGR
jgi:hypothetical protein